MIAAVTSFEIRKNRKLGAWPTDTDLLVYGVDANTGLENLLGEIVGIPDRLTAEMVGRDLVSGEMAFVGGGL